MTWLKLQWGSYSERTQSLLVATAITKYSFSLPRWFWLRFKPGRLQKFCWCTDPIPSVVCFCHLVEPTCRWSQRLLARIMFPGPEGEVHRIRDLSRCQDQLPPLFLSGSVPSPPAIDRFVPSVLSPSLSGGPQSAGPSEVYETVDQNQRSGSDSWFKTSSSWCHWHQPASCAGVFFFLFFWSIWLKIWNLSELKCFF